MRACGLALAVIGATAAAQSPAPAVEPVVLLATAADGGPPGERDRRVRGCGLRATFASGPVVEVLNLREGDATVMRLTVAGVAAPGEAARVSLATASEDTAAWLTTAPASAAGVLQAGGVVDADAGARLFQQLMVGGGMVRIDRGGAVQTLTVAGPLAPGLRSAYLNCAGDLFPRTR
jgi:hypothetical protein